MLQIEQQPGIGSPRKFKNPSLAGLRSWPVPGFEEIRIYYLRPMAGVIRIVRILHGRRDLGKLFDRPEK